VARQSKEFPVTNVADEVLRLRFTGRHVESMYRNDDRIRELFVGRIGAIARLTRAAAKGANGSIGLKGIAELAGERNWADTVEYDLHDPTAQALVLREALGNQHELHSAATAAPGQYVSVTGVSCLSRPTAEPGGFNFHPNCRDSSDPVFAALDQARAMQEALYRSMTPGEEQMWLLTISDANQDITAAAILLRHWINTNAFMSYMHMPWEMFGTLRERVAGVPMLAAIHVIARLDLSAI
jgi:hypothetical protein